MTVALPDNERGSDQAAGLRSSGEIALEPSDARKPRARAARATSRLNTPPSAVRSILVVLETKAEQIPRQ